ncbi:MAG: hypothetical protein EOP84_35625 [Verrucomicrobiaceae bacterium]|nr:MAG: hypothetical protein EOP84_35625 [Verrucomicrobiaceae bacterium]
MSVGYTFHVRFVPDGRTLTLHQEQEWARLRVRQNPESGGIPTKEKNTSFLGIKFDSTVENEIGI